MKSNLPERFERSIWYIIAAILVYNLSPIALVLLRSPLYNLLPPFYLCTNLVIGFLYGRKIGTDPILPVCLCIAFIPTIYIFFNSTVWIYQIGYFLLSLLGMAIGKVYKGRMK